jgi:hypothetical protein
LTQSRADDPALLRLNHQKLWAAGSPRTKRVLRIIGIAPLMAAIRA